MLMVWRDDDKKFHSQFLSYQGVLNWNLIEICHKQKYSTSLLFLGSLLDHFIGHHLHRTSLNQSFIKLWRSLFGDNRTIQTSPEVAEPKIHSITGCSFSSCRGSATRVNEMDCREGGVRKRKTTTLKIYLWAQAPWSRFFCHTFLTPPFKARKSICASFEHNGQHSLATSEWNELVSYIYI